MHRGMARRGTKGGGGGGLILNLGISHEPPTEGGGTPDRTQHAHFYLALVTQLTAKTKTQDGVSQREGYFQNRRLKFYYSA